MTELQKLVLTTINRHPRKDPQWLAKLCGTSTSVFCKAAWHLVDLELVAPERNFGDSKKYVFVTTNSGAKVATDLA